MKLTLQDVCNGNLNKIEAELSNRERGWSEIKAQAFVMTDDYFPSMTISLLCYSDILIQIPL